MGRVTVHNILQIGDEKTQQKGDVLLEHQMYG